MPMRSLLLSCLLTAAAATGAPASDQDGPAPGFAQAYQSAVTAAGNAFEAALPFEAEKTLKTLSAASGADAGKIEKFRRLVEAIESVRKPVPAPAGPNQSDILETAYVAKVTKISQDLKADALKALEARRRLLRISRGEPAAAGDAPGGLAPSAEVQRRLDAQAARRRVNMGNVHAMAGQLDLHKGDAGAVPNGSVAARAPAPPRGVSVENLHAGDFILGQHLKTGAVPAAPAAHVEIAPGHEEPPSPGLWDRTKSALTTPLSGVQASYHAFSERRMAESERLTQEGAKRLEQGGVRNTLAAGWDATLAWGNRVAAGDKKAVTQLAVGAGVAIVAVVAAPAVGAATVAAGIGTVVEAGVAGLTTYNVIKGTAALAHEPNAANAALLAVNFAPVPYLGKIAHAAGNVAEKGVVALRSGATDSKLLAASLSGMVAIGEKFGQKEVEVLAKTAVHDMTHVAGHQAAHAVVHDAAHSMEHSIPVHAGAH